MSHATYDAAQVGGNPNTNPLCGKTIRVERGGKTVDVLVVDRCEGCAPDDVDLSPAAFDELATVAEGRVKANWSWV